MGYESLSIALSEQKEFYLVQLKNRPTQLGEVEIKSDWSFLYDLILSSKENDHSEVIPAKTYYQLQSEVDQKATEFIEAHYNGELLAHDIKDLQLKNGRIVLLPFQNRMWVSTESSKAIYMHHLFQHSQYFPTSPFALNKRKLKKYYRIAVENSYSNEQQERIYVLYLEPKEKPYNYFEAKIWINQDQKRLLKVELSCERTALHPFLPHGNIKYIESVGLQLNKQFTTIRGKQYLESLDFIYELDYLSRQGSKHHSITNCILKAYDYQSQFLLPQFNYPPEEQNDYRKINAAPYNAFFWNNVMLKRADMNRLFYKMASNDSAITQNELFRKNNYFNKGFFESPYIHWSKNRIRIKAEQNHFVQDRNNMSFIQGDLYRLEAQIYLDVNQIDDSIHYISSAVFDPFNSYYRFDLDPAALAFMNIYFDWVELFRREIDKEFALLKSPEAILSAFEVKKKALKLELDQYLKEVQRGKNYDALKAYNAIVLEKTGIDNIEIFNVKKP